MRSCTRRPRIGRAKERQMIAIVASQLLGFIIGGGIFLLRHDRGDFATF
jgi:hypothetical protein